MDDTAFIPSLVEVNNDVAWKNVLNSGNSFLQNDKLLSINAGKALIREHQRARFQRPPPVAELVLHGSGGVVHHEPVPDETVSVFHRQIVHVLRDPIDLPFDPDNA